MMDRADKISQMLLENAWFDPQAKDWLPLPAWKRRELEAELDAIEAAEDAPSVEFVSPEQNTAEVAQAKAEGRHLATFHLRI